MDKLVAETISKIKKQKIQPEPRWKFVLKKYSIWLAFFAGLLMGAISLAVAFDWLGQLDWDIYHFSRPGFFFGFLSIIPHLWLALVVLFLVFAFIDFRKTENGYRFNFGKISLIIIVSLIFLGVAFFMIGIGGRFHAAVSKKVPFYGNQMMMVKEGQWMRPEEGFLAGRVISNEKNNFILQDFNGRKWTIILDEKTLIMPMAKISEGEIIKTMGRKISEDNFVAQQIRPWTGKRMMGESMREQRMPKNNSGDLLPLPMRRQ